MARAAAKTARAAAAEGLGMAVAKAVVREAAQVAGMVETAKE